MLYMLLQGRLHYFIGCHAHAQCKCHEIAFINGGPLDEQASRFGHDILARWALKLREIIHFKGLRFMNDQQFQR